MYPIMSQNEGRYLYLEAGTPVAKEESEDVSAADRTWKRTGIGVITNGQPLTTTLARKRMQADEPTSARTRTQTDELPRTSAGDRTQMDGWPPPSEQDRTQKDRWPWSSARELTQLDGWPPPSARDRTQLGGWPPPSVQDRTQTDGWPRTSERDRTQTDGFLASRDERSDHVRQRFFAEFNRTEHERDLEKYEATRNGDLVLLRRAALDDRRDKKLEPRWGGPFRLDNIAHHGRSGRLYDLLTGQLVKTKISGLKDRVHLDDPRVFVARTEEGSKDDGVQCVEMSCDEKRMSDESVWKEVCSGGTISLEQLLMEDMGRSLSREGPLAGVKGSSCGIIMPRVAD